jgi:hypothetical protein
MARRRFEDARHLARDLRAEPANNTKSPTVCLAEIAAVEKDRVIFRVAAGYIHQTVDHRIPFDGHDRPDFRVRLPRRKLLGGIPPQRSAKSGGRGGRQIVSSSNRPENSSAFGETHRM